MSILSVQDISKSYKLRQVVKSLSVEIKSGEVVGLMIPLTIQNSSRHADDLKKNCWCQKDK